MTDAQVVLLSRLIGGYILASSSDDPQKLTQDYKGYFENFLLQPDWQKVITEYEVKVMASLPKAPSGPVAQPPVPTPQ